MGYDAGDGKVGRIRVSQEMKGGQVTVLREKCSKICLLLSIIRK